MKFQKGLLSDTEKQGSTRTPDLPTEPPIPVATPVSQELKVRPAEQVLSEVEKNRLFETVEEKKKSSRSYLTVLSVVAGLVIVAAAAGSYLMLPGIGDRILAPKGLDAVVRDHFLTRQKRDVTDIVVYQCEGFLWARVGVETRSDLANPAFRIGTYAARAIPDGDNWEISAAPITTAEMDVPCGQSNTGGS